MAAPDIVNAFLGATVGAGVVGPIFEKLIEGLKHVYHCNAECAALQEELVNVKPMLERIFDQQKQDITLRNWVVDFEKCVAQAHEILKACKTNNNGIWDRFHEVQYGVQILELKDRVRANVSLAPLALLSLHSGSKRGTCGIVQGVPKKILGMEDHFKRVKSLVLEGYEGKGNSCVGIRGMGGAGKTLLAQMVNNDKEIQRMFGEDSVIWITIGRDADILVLYKKMRNCLQVCSAGGSVEDQRTELMNAFLKRRVLLILDDVWDGILHKCEEMVDWLNIARGPGSVTLLTTRDESVICKCVSLGEEIILRLSEEQSWELFCIHAFGTDSPNLDKDMKGVVMDVCKECKCLPLALKVLGRAMKGKINVSAWRRMLRHLQASSTVNKSVEQQLFGRLRFSYDQLNKVQKTCFIYFAAFPEDYEIPMQDLCQMWVVEGLLGEDLDMMDALDEVHGVVNELLGLSLIEWCRDHKNAQGKSVKMHDILRDLAIQIANEGNESERESLFEVEKRNREEFPRAWLGSTMKVKRLSMWGNEMNRFPDDFIAPNLKICRLYPSSRTYTVTRSRRHVVNLEDFFGNLHGLRYLQMCYNRNIWQLPENVGGMQSLQHLNLSYCTALEELPESIGGLGSLQHLDLLHCSALKQLPKSMGRLRSLQHLNLLECEALEELPESTGGLRSLQHLNLSRCKALKQLPKSMGGLGSLQYLDLSRCLALEQLPESMGGLEFLQHLDLSYCSALEKLPESMGGLGSLQHLDLLYCWALKHLPKSMGGLGSLQYLDLSRCWALEQLPESMGGLVSLQQLNLSECEALEQLPKSMGRLESLQYLNLSQCMALKQLPDNLGGLGSLQHLNLSTCRALEQLPESMEELGSLRHLNLSRCSALEKLPESMGGLGSLQHLNLLYCWTLKQLPESMGGLGSLQYLDLSYCWALEQLPKSMGRLRSLQHLNLLGCLALEQLPESTGGLGFLQHLNLSQCKALKQLPESMGGLGSLQDLNLSRCRALEELPKSMGGLESLQLLNLSYCWALEQLPESMGRLRSLQHLNLLDCLALEELPESTGGLRSLQHLNLSRCKALKQLPKSMGGLGSLQHLDLSYCSALEQLPESMGRLRFLQHLNLLDCLALEELPESMGRLESLQYLHLSQCNFQTSWKDWGPFKTMNTSIF